MVLIMTRTFVRGLMQPGPFFTPLQRARVVCILDKHAQQARLRFSCCTRRIFCDHHSGIVDRLAGH